MVCPGGTRSVSMPAFWTKTELHFIFLRKKAFIITSKHGTTIFFFYCNLFLVKLLIPVIYKTHMACEAGEMVFFFASKALAVKLPS